MTSEPSGNSPEKGTELASAKPELKGTFTLGRQPKTLGRLPVEAHKFETAPPSAAPAPAVVSDEDLGELPQSYLEDTIFAVARDPQWLFIYWDVDFHRIPAEATKESARKIFLKTFSAAGEESCIHVNPEARNWYAPVDRAGEEYWAELGYFDQGDAWHAVVTSRRTKTPESHVQGESADDAFVTVPVHLTFQHLLNAVQKAMADGESLLSAVSRLQGEGRRLAFLPGRAPDWTEDQKRILATLLGTEIIDQISLGSEEIDQLLRKQLGERLNTESASELSAAGRFSEIFGGSSELFGAVESSLFSGIGASWSGQPFGQAERGFFMHVNAEVIFYGGTHPDAKVTIGGNPVQLQPDGSFRYHFKFPDGSFEIPIVAVSPDGVETRSALLDFRRGTERQGEVGHTGQPAELADEPMGRR